ncbi:TetR/AcrR family transcriptional regulator [Brevibacillus panacihumi]
MKHQINIEDGRHLRSMKTRNKIINAAHHVFLKEGFQNTTIKQIIEQAKTGYGTAYGHFKGKDDLLIILMEDVMNQF